MSFLRCRSGACDHEHHRGPQPCLICGDKLYDDEVARHMQEHADAAPDIMADALREIRQEATDNISGATEDRGSDTRWSRIIDMVDAALRKAGADVKD